MNPPAESNGLERSGMPARRVMRVGDRVSPPAGWWTPAVHALLRYLQDAGIAYAPRVLGLDDRGREVPCYIPGRSGRAGWAAIVDDGGLARFARLLRAYHDAVRGFRPPAGAAWACTDAPLGAGELVCHGDFGPWNVVWHDRRPVGILDWDLAGRGPPIDDVAYALEYGVPFRDDRTALRWLAYQHPPDRRHRSGCSPVPTGCRRPPGWSTRSPAASGWTWCGSAPWPSGACSPRRAGSLKGSWTSWRHERPGPSNTARCSSDPPPTPRQPRSDKQRAIVLRRLGPLGSAHG